MSKNPAARAQELALAAYEVTSEDAGELVAALEHAATCGENELGEEFFAEFMGDFWTMVEARPYMRTIKELAKVLWNVGRRFDAVAHYENLIDLDPADHMGNSSLLLGYYLSMGEIQRSWDLLEEYNDDAEAVFNWAWVLLFLRVGDEDASRDALDHAMEANSHVAMLLVGMGAESGEELPPPTCSGQRTGGPFLPRYPGRGLGKRGRDTLRALKYMGPNPGRSKGGVSLPPFF